MKKVITIIKWLVVPKSAVMTEQEVRDEAEQNVFLALEDIVEVFCKYNLMFLADFANVLANELKARSKESAKVKIELLKGSTC